LEALHDSVNTKVYGAFGQYGVTILNLFGAKPVDFELEQKFALEAGKESLPGAIAQKTI
jgi:hypothetical protein